MTPDPPHAFPPPHDLASCSIPTNTYPVPLPVLSLTTSQQPTLPHPNKCPRVARPADPNPERAHTAITCDPTGQACVLTYLIMLVTCQTREYRHHHYHIHHMFDL